MKKIIAYFDVDEEILDSTEEGGFSSAMSWAEDSGCYLKGYRDGEELTKEKIEKAMQCLADNGIPEDELFTVCQALVYILADEDIEEYFQKAKEIYLYKSHDVPYNITIL